MLLIGAKVIAKFLGISPPTLFKMRRELRRVGALAYQMRGCPKRRWMVTFDDLLYAWMGLKIQALKNPTPTPPLTEEEVEWAEKMRAEDEWLAKFKTEEDDGAAGKE